MEAYASKEKEQKIVLTEEKRVSKVVGYINLLLVSILTCK